MELGPDLPRHVPLQYTACLMIGACSEWLPRHSEYLGGLFPYLVTCLDQPELADAASLSIKNVCDTCCNHFIDEATATSLMQLYGKTESLGQQSAMELTQAIAYVVSAMPVPMVQAAMPEMVHPLLTKIQGHAGQYVAVSLPSARLPGLCPTGCNLGQPHQLAPPRVQLAPNRSRPNLPIATGGRAGTRSCNLRRATGPRRARRSSRTR
eukprot:SAG22_NODE_2136_length_2957_cov_1.888034_4_plen_209_part_00